MRLSSRDGDRAEKIEFEREVKLMMSKTVLFRCIFGVLRNLLKQNGDRGGLKSIWVRVILKIGTTTKKKHTHRSNGHKDCIQRGILHIYFRIFFNCTLKLKHQWVNKHTQTEIKFKRIITIIK